MKHRCGIVAHGYHLRRKGNLYPRRQCINPLLLQAFQDLFALPHQYDLHIIGLCRGNCAHDRSLGGIIASHSVYDNLHRMLLSPGSHPGNDFVNGGKRSAAHLQIAVMLFPLEFIVQLVNDAEIHIHRLEPDHTFIADVSR